MNRVSGQDLGDSLRLRIGKASRIAIIGVGDELLPFDRLGMVAAKMIDRLHLLHVGVFFAGTVPESVTAPVRRFRPDHTIFMDAADMGAEPGTIAVIDSRSIPAVSSRPMSCRSRLSWTILNGRSGRGLPCWVSSRIVWIPKKDYQGMMRTVLTGTWRSCYQYFGTGRSGKTGTRIFFRHHANENVSGTSVWRSTTTASAGVGFTFICFWNFVWDCQVPALIPSTPR